MATNRWLGVLEPVAKVVTLTVAGTPANGDTIYYTIGGVTITYTLTGSDTAITAASEIYDLLSASEAPAFGSIEWTYTAGDAFVTGTAAAAGTPWTGTAGDTGTTTFTETVVTAGSSPNSAGSTGNWSLGALPTTGDDVLIDGGPDLLWDLDDLSAAVYGSLRVKASFTGTIGLPFRNPAGYVEYLERFFPVGTGVPVTIGEGDGDGPTRVNLSVSTALSCVVRKTGARADPTAPVVNIKTCSSGTLTVAGGDAGLAADDDTTSCTVATINLDNDGAIVVGKGATATAVNQTGGALLGVGTVTTLTQAGGAAVLYTAPTTVTTDGGAVDLRFTGTVTTITARGQGADAAPFVECSGDPRAKTFTNSTFTGGAVLNDPDKSVTFTNPATTDRASVRASDFGARMSLQRT